MDNEPKRSAFAIVTIVAIMALALTLLSLACRAGGALNAAQAAGRMASENREKLIPIGKAIVELKTDVKYMRSGIERIEKAVQR